jgi:hypothetical protein
MALSITPISSSLSISNDTSSTGPFYPSLATATSGSLTTATITSTKLYFAPSTGQLNATELNSLSDETKKTNIKTITDSINKVKSLRGVTFNWKEDYRPSLGLIAQEVESVLPELIAVGPEGEKTLSYGNIVGLLIEAIKDQQKQIEDLQQSVYK